MPALDVEARPDSVPRARGFARELLDGWGVGDLRDDVDLLITELMTNAVLHAPGRARVVVAREPDGVRLEVLDSSPTAPVRRSMNGAATTGRGLNLVSALATSWGVSARGDGLPGKAVWCRVGHERLEQQVPDIDLEELLAAFDDDGVDGVTVPVGQAPVAVLLEAKDHLDGLLRELALADGSSGLPQEVVDSMADAVRHFDAARTQLRALLTAATARGDDRVDIVFRHLPTGLAEVGEEYLAALRTADEFARDRRMLSLASPVEYRVLREWYVEGLVAGLRDARAGRPLVAGESFEHRLLRELHELEEGRRVAELAGQLQRVTARLAAVETADEIARTAVSEGMLALGAVGGQVTRTASGQVAAVVEVGVDEGVAARCRAVPASQRQAGPSADAVRTGQAVYVEGREDRDARYPHLAAVPPGRSALVALPLLVQGRAIGTLGLSWTSPHVFTDAERVFLAGLAAQTAQAVDRAEALRRLHTLRDEVERLLPVAGRVSSTDLGVLRTLYDDAPVGISVHDAQGRYLRVNELVAALGRRPASDHVGRTVGQVLTDPALGPMRAQLQGLLERVLAHGVPAEDELVQPAAVGGRSWRCSCFPVRAADGTVEAVVVLWIEITAQRAAEQRALLLATLGDRLGRGRTVEEVLEAAADAVLPQFGDWAVVHLATGSGTVAALVRPAVPAGAVTGAVTGAVSVDDPTGPGRALATGRSAPLDLPGQGGVSVPLTVAGRVAGVLTVGRPTVRGGLAASDVAAVEDLARRVGGALDRVELSAVEGERDRVLSGMGHLNDRLEVVNGRLGRANERLGLLNRIGAALTATLDVDEALTRLGDLLVASSLADLVTIDLREHGDVRGDREVVSTAADPAKATALRASDARSPRRRNTGSAVHRVLHGTPYVHLVVTPEDLERAAADPAQLEVFRALELRHAVVVPLAARGRVLGALSLLRTGDVEAGRAAAPFEDDDVLFALEVGRRAGLMVDNAAQYTAQRAVAEGLQRSLLPELPVVEGVELGAAYEPSSSAAQIGGDWYDAFVLPDGAVGLVIGDVMGHDIAAAAAMGQLRSVLRTCAADGDRPAVVLDRLDRLVSSFAMADLATVVYARLDRRDTGALLSFANAGHPPPLLLDPDGSATFLDDGRSIMIGAPAGSDVAEPRQQGERALAPGATLVMFTDGLVERRGQHLDDQLAALAALASDLWRELDDPGELCRRLIAQLPRDDDSDDVAVVALTLRVPGSTGPPPR